MPLAATLDSPLPTDKTPVPEPWWLRAAPRRMLLLALALLPLLTPVISPRDDGLFIYPYCAAMHLLAGWFCWKASQRYLLEKIRWQTVVLAQCLHAVPYLIAAQDGLRWIDRAKGAWLANGCISVCWVLFLPALMGVRSVRGRWVRTLDYLLAAVASALMTRALGSGSDPGNGWTRIIVIEVVVAAVLLAALVSRVASTKPGIKLFSSVISVYLAESLLVGFLLNVANLAWVRQPHILFSDLLVALPPLVLCDLAVMQRRPLAQGPELEPMVVDSLQPAILATGGMLLALFGLRTHALLEGVVVVVLMLCYALRTQLFNLRLLLREKQLRLQATQMQELATRDPLTGVGNRRWFDEEAARLLRAERSYPCSLVLLDTDHFKEVNDTRGHLAGDEVLRAVAAVLTEATAQVKRGCQARIGGDEFGALWPGTEAEQALQLAEWVRAGMAERVFGDDLTVSVSIGVATVRAPLPLIELMKSADAVLYQAKTGGRNAVRGVTVAAV